MKKIFFVLVLAAILATGTAFADYPGGWGIGIQGGGIGNWGGGWFGGAALSLKVPSLPIFWAIDFAGGNNYFMLGVSGDYYLVHSALVPAINLDWYLGIGAYVTLGLGGYDFFGVGGRVPIGLSWQPINFLEVYLQLVPSIGAGFSSSNFGLGGGFGGNIGIRFWL